MAQASVLTETDIRRVFRVIETTRHAERNRLAFVLSIYAGLRVGEIAALRFGDVVNQHGEVRREIKLGADQTKGSKGRTVVLSGRVGRDQRIAISTHPFFSPAKSTRFLKRYVVDAVQGIYDAAGLRTSSHSGRRTFATRLNAKGVGMRTI